LSGSKKKLQNVKHFKFGCWKISMSWIRNKQIRRKLKSRQHNNDLMLMRVQQLVPTHHAAIRIAEVQKQPSLTRILILIWHARWLAVPKANISE